MSPSIRRPFTRRLPSLRADEGAVSEVLATALLVGMTVVVLGGFSAVVLTTMTQGSATPPTSSFSMDAPLGDGQVAVTMVSGASFDLDAARLVLLVNGSDARASHDLLPPSSPTRWSPGGVLRVNLTGGSLAAGQQLLFMAVDAETGKPIGTTRATVLGPSELPAYVTSVPTIAGASVEPALLTVDGRTLANVSVTVSSTFGLDLVKSVTLNLSRVGGAAVLALQDHGAEPDEMAGDGVWSGQFVATSYSFDAKPTTETVRLPIAVADILGNVAQGDVTLSLQPAPLSKAVAGAIYEDLPSSATVANLNLTNFTFRDQAQFDNDQMELRVSDLLDSSKHWSVLVSFSYTGCGNSPGITQIKLTRDDIAGSAVYTPNAAPPCFAVGPYAQLDLASPATSKDNANATISWSVSGDESTFRYAAVGISGDNEGIVTFVGDTTTLGPSAIGYGQADLRWTTVGAASATAPDAPTGLTATRGDGSVSLSWVAPADDGGSAITGYKVYRGTASGATTYLTTVGATTSHLDTGLTNGVTYYYNVTAVNAEGEGPSSNEASATPAAVPSAPQSLAATGGNQTVSLSWVAPSSDGGSAIVNYHVYRGTGGTRTHLASTGGANTSFVDATAANGVTYHYNVTAETAVGQGTSSSVASATPSTVPNPPATFAATGGDAKVTLSWTAGDDGGSALTTYKVYRGVLPGVTTFLASTGSGANTSFVDATVTNGVTYYYNVTAVNANGESASTPEASATPASGTSAPSAPQSLAATGGNNSVALSWSAPSSDGGSAITEYYVYRGTTSGATTWLATTGAANTTFTVNGLANGQTYFFNVTAVNAIGQGPSSNEASATPAGPPYPPTGLQAARGNQSATLSWTAPANDGSSAITNYHVYRGTSPGAATYLASTGGANASFVANGLTNGVTYYFNVTAQNAVGQSASSNEASVVPATVPNPPFGVSATPGSGQVTVAWSVPSNGGSAVTTFKIYRGTASGNAVFLASTASGANTTFVDATVTNGNTYYYNVTAVNAVGESASSAEASATPAGAPSAPQSLAATAGNQSVSLSWSAPASNGGSAVTNYHVYRGTTSGATTWIASTGGSNTTFVANGLTNGVTYYFNVTAANAVGQGPSSNEASATPVTTPNPPSGLTATRGNQSVSLSWTAPSNGGSVITGYKIYRGTTSGAATFLTTVATTSHVDTGLTNGVTYYYNVTAVNAVGESASSAEASATPAAVPHPPTGLGATAASGQVSLSWTAPSNNGGSIVTGYQVHRGTTSGSLSLLATIGTNTSFTDLAVAGGTTYYYHVRAVNALGASNPSNEASATPSSAGSTPDAPQSLTLTPATSRVAMTWSAPASDGGSAVTGYRIYRSTTNSTGSMTLLASIGTNTTFTDLAVTNNVTYYYQVSATNANGEGARTAIKDATPTNIATIDCTTMVISSGTGSCSDIQKDDGILGTFQESSGATKVFSATFSVNMTGITGTQTLAIEGNPANAAESMLLQALNPPTGVYDTIVTLPSTAVSGQTYTGPVAQSYWSTGKLQLRLIDGEVNNAQSSWSIDYAGVIVS